MRKIRTALKLLMARVSWSLKKPKSFTSNFQGRNAIVICNGPSLKNTDFHLNDVLKIGMNRIYISIRGFTCRCSCRNQSSCSGSILEGFRFS